MKKPNPLYPDSNCVVHEDDIGFGGKFLWALDISPTKTYIYSMKERGNYEKER